MDLSTLSQYDKPVPRYTSYPTAPKFASIEESLFLSHLQRVKEPLSIYIHIPFCRSMCLFCGCSVILNRSEARQANYVAYLLQEISRVGEEMGARKLCSQLHLGGGTPTSLTEEQFDLLMGRLREFFELKGEIAIEVDPRTVFADGGKKLEHLRKLGFNRVSFGVQDLDEKVQEAVKRRQSKEMSHRTLEMARALGFSGINLDLIYGLPHQTVASFRKTAEEIALWRPDRIALFSYAKVPHLKAHQKAIPEEALPSTEEKFQIYLEARRIFLEAGYVPIGMDHFALPEDSLAIALEQGKLGRNFQGYTVEAGEDLIPFGVSSIGSIDGNYFQNVKTLEEYTARLDVARLPVYRGLIVSEEDRLRRWVIQRLMCRFAVDKRAFEAEFGVSFDVHFARELERIDPELAINERDCLRATPFGQLLIRLVASTFDAHLHAEGSRAI